MGDLISGEATVAQAAELCKIYEGYRAKVYKCPAGVWTIGWGRTGTDVNENSPITTMLKEAEWLTDRLERDLVFLRNKLRPLILNANQEAALLSFMYNVGQGNFLKSSVFRILRESENKTLDTHQLKAYWLQWTKAAGKVLPGLVRRRNAEVNLFFSPVD
jgi:lysozyme